MTGWLDDTGADLVRDVVQSEERELRRRLGAPIFVALMLKHQMNPLGFETWRDDTRLENGSGDLIRLSSRVLWMQTRPDPKPLV